MHFKTLCALGFLLSASAGAQVQPAPRPGSSPQAFIPDPNAPRPIDAYDSVWIENLTWMEVRDAMREGKTTVIIATGGVEQNGPYLVTGKHNVILRATAETVARKLGDALRSAGVMLPIVLATSIDEGALPKLQRAGYDLYLPKPYRTRDIRAAAERFGEDFAHQSVSRPLATKAGVFDYEMG